MLDFYKKIQRVLELEKQKGFSNSAVAGGLQNFTNFISNQQKKLNIPINTAELLINLFEDYSTLSHPDRKNIVNQLIKWLNDDPLNTSLPKTLISQDQRHSISVQGEKDVHQDPAIYADLQLISGVGQKNIKYFEKLNVTNIYQLLRYYPRKYQDYSQLKTISQITYGEEITLTGIILGDLITRSSKRGNLKLTEAVLSDSTGTLKLTWFNQPFLKNQIKAGMSIVVSGKVDTFRGRFTMTSPVWERLEKEQIHTNRIVPIYPATAGISQRQIRNIIKKNINFWATKVLEYLPKDILCFEKFEDITYSLQQIHFPDSFSSLSLVKKRFAFEEIFFLHLGYLYQKSSQKIIKAKSFGYDDDLISDRKKQLPYKLTTAQERAISKIISDLSSNKPMNRLLQGDVGSGKTVVAKFAIESIIDNGSQACVLAPTSILAEQHFKTLNNLLSKSGCTNSDEVGLLLGNTSQKDKSEILQRLKSGEIKCIIGTHALLEDPVIFKDLQIIIIDEQHRFGVNQRNIIKAKGNNPHTLVMSATPIPRSLALTIYGDLDVTTIDEMPPGRLPVNTRIIRPDKKLEAYKLVKDQIQKGFQAFIVYPMIEGEEENIHKSVIAESKRLQKEVFLNYKVGLLHGKMTASEKDTIMMDFRNHNYDVLVSTTVIEVGVDIPDATIVIIESANNFGLSQLHQIRGRVGRNSEESYCLLIPDTEDSSENERLKAMVYTNDGFELADIDLKLRGPGEFLGTRQSGYVGFKFADITNTKLIETSREYVHNIIDADPKLEHAENQLLREELINRWPGINIPQKEKDSLW